MDDGADLWGGAVPGGGDSVFQPGTQTAPGFGAGCGIKIRWFGRGGYCWWGVCHAGSVGQADGDCVDFSVADDFDAIDGVFAVFGAEVGAVPIVEHGEGDGFDLFLAPGDDGDVADVGLVDPHVDVLPVVIAGIEYLDLGEHDVDLGPAGDFAALGGGVAGVGEASGRVGSELGRSPSHVGIGVGEDSGAAFAADEQAGQGQGAQNEGF